MAKVWRIVEPELYNELMDIYKQRLMDNIRTKDVHTAGEVQETVLESDGACVQPIVTNEFPTEPQQVVDTEQIITDEKASSPVNDVHDTADKGSYNYNGEWDSIQVIRERAAEGGGRTKKGPKQSRRVHKPKGGKRSKKKVIVHCIHFSTF